MTKPILLLVAIIAIFEVAGASSVMAWWWLYKLFSRPDWMQENSILFFFLSVYLAGAILHLEVIGRSFALSKMATFAPVAGAVLVSVLVAIYA